MNHKEKIQKYYLYGLVPVLVLWGLFSFFVDQVYAIFFLIGFTWPYTFHAPGFEDKASSSRYKYSVLGNLFKFQTALYDRLPENPAPWMKPMLRLVVPILLTGVISIINPNATPLWAILGWLCFELFAFLNKKNNWDFF